MKPEHDIPPTPVIKRRPPPDDNLIARFNEVYIPPVVPKTPKGEWTYIPPKT